MELFTKIAIGFEPLDIFAKNFIFDFWHASEYASENDFT